MIQEKGDNLDKFELEIYEEKCSNFNKECSDLFENCDKKDVENIIAEQHQIQEIIHKLWVMIKRKTTK